ncbi:MAG: hypothetical protein ABF535_08480 [Acetobacter sp.]
MRHPGGDRATPRVAPRAERQHTATTAPARPIRHVLPGTIVGRMFHNRPAGA